MDINDYLEIFIEESKEHLQSINEQLLLLEEDAKNVGIVNEIFRSAHTLKGMAGTMGYEDLASLTHQMENVLDLLRNAKLEITSEIMDVIFKCVDLIEKMVESIEQGGDGKEDVRQVVNQLTMIYNGKSISEVSAQDAAPQVATALESLSVDQFQASVIREAKAAGNHVYQITVRMDPKCVMKAVRAYMVFQAAEEMGEIIQTNPTVEQIEEEKFDDAFTLLIISERNAQDIQKPLENISEVEEVSIFERVDQEVQEESQEPLKKEGLLQEGSYPVDSKAASNETNQKKKQRSKSIRVDIDKLDHLMNLFSELIIDRGRLEQIGKKSQMADLTETVEHMTRISTDLQGLILNMRMVPVDQVFNRFPRMVRDLAKELNKKIQLIIEGADTELDRTVIDEIGDPLVHLLRNALDHGLESPEERVASNKQEEGTILLKAYHSGNHVFIQVTDDGKGIHREKVLSKAVERGVVRAEEAKTLTDQQVYALIFSSGFSTADKVSDISGRGVGLDVVKSKIQSLGGVISIDSNPGKGSTFLIQLPLTLSIIYAMLVKVVEETYAIPFSSIVEITTATPDQVSTVHGQKVIQFRGQVVPLIYAQDVFKVPTIDADPNCQQLSIVIVRKGNKTIGIVVDEVLGQQEVVLKSLGNYLTNISAISGATILGNGEVALIIDPNQLIH